MAKRKLKSGDMMAKLFKIKPGLICLVLAYACGCTSSPTRDQNMSVSYIMAGNENAEKGKFELAKKEYLLALKFDPNSLAAKRNLGIVYVKLGQYKKSIELLHEVNPEYSSDAEVDYFLGEAYRGLGFYSDAQNSYAHGISLAPNDERIIKSIAWVELKQNKIEKAKQRVMPLYKKNPYDIQLMLIMSTVYVKSKDYASTLKILKNFEGSHYKLSSPNKELAETEKILLLDILGDTYFGLGNCAQAQQLYGMILSLRPYLAAVLTKSAKCDIQQNLNTVAVQKLEKAHASDPMDIDTLFWLGQVYASTNPSKSAFYYQLFLDRSADNQLYSAQALRAQSAINQTGIKK